MKIQQGQFSLSASHQAFQHQEQHETLHLLRRTAEGEQSLEWRRRSAASEVTLSQRTSLSADNENADEVAYPALPGRRGIGQALGLRFAPAPGQDKFERHTDRAGVDEKHSQQINGGQSVDGENVTDAETIEELRMLTFIRLMEQMFGLKVSIKDSDDLAVSEKDRQKLQAVAEKMQALPDTEAMDQEAPPETGYRMTYTRKTVYREEEHTRMQAQGQVTTQDGRSLSLELDIGMSRTFQSESFLSISEGNLKDPLVINFDRPTVGLSDKLHFQFDLDADGQDETLPELLAGSGYLALDLNEDGVINSGNELFGAKTGDGFAELAKYDDDANGFIDENDAVFSQLKIWVPKGEGEAELFALLDKDVGAIYLKSEQTPFALKTERTNETQGYVRESGIFLKESGGIASVQQIDLKV